MTKTRSVEKGASVCTIIDFNGTVIHKVMGSTLAAESAALANAVDRR